MSIKQHKMKPDMLNLAMAEMLFAQRQVEDKPVTVVEDAPRGVEMVLQENILMDIPNRYDFFSNPRKPNKGLKLGIYNSKSKNKAK